MLRSLYSGVSGMRGFQTKMDVIANNVANVNTTAFKSGRARFQDMLSQTSSNAQAPTDGGLGGINAQQVGLGVTVGAIDNVMTGGSLQPTNRALDFAIENEGFFVVNQGGGSGDVYTRDGGFYADHEGNLVNANGYSVRGYPHEDLADGKADLTKPLVNMKIYKYSLDGTGDADKLQIEKPTTTDYYTLQDFTIDGSGLIKGIYSDGENAKEINIGKLAMATFNNPEGLEKAGNNNFVQSNNSGTVAVGEAGSAGYGSIRQGFLEMSNVDLANEFTEMIVASRAYQANSRSITTSDEMIQELINLKR